MDDLTRQVYGEAFELAREAQAAGLVVTLIAPHRCGRDTEYRIALWMPDGKMWAEATHETAEGIREQIIGGYRRHHREECPCGTPGAGTGWCAPTTPTM